MLVTIEIIIISGVVYYNRVMENILSLMASSFIVDMVSNTENDKPERRSSEDVESTIHFEEQ